MLSQHELDLAQKKIRRMKLVNVSFDPNLEVNYFFQCDAQRKDEKFTICILRDKNRTIKGIGVAAKNPIDSLNPMTGEDIAFSRAVENLFSPSFI